MKVYVDKGKLESHDIQSITDLGGKEFQQVRVWFKDTDNVEIVPLADYTKQVRKEVCERLDKIIEKYLCKKGRYRESLDISSIIKQVMKESLDQIQGEIK